MVLDQFIFYFKSHKITQCKSQNKVIKKLIYIVHSVKPVYCRYTLSCRRRTSYSSLHVTDITGFLLYTRDLVLIAG